MRVRGGVWQRGEERRGEVNDLVEVVVESGEESISLQMQRPREGSRQWSSRMVVRGCW
jgi:hypothetical protein